MNNISNSFTSIEQVAGQYLNQSSEVENKNSSSVSFENVLKNQISSASETTELKFSKHAMARLDSRDISLSEEQSERLVDGVAKASEKGIKDSLVMVDSLAFIVNIPNQTVVTAMDQSDAMENVFTNIDGAVII